MKKLFLACAVAVAGLVNAQEATTAATGLDGAWWGMGTLQYTNNDATDVSTFTIMPVVGNFISPTVTVGLGAGYIGSKNGEDADWVNSFALTPLARKYWGVANNLYIFGQAAVPMTFSDDVNTFGFQLSPGVDYFLSDQFTIEATIGGAGYTNYSPEVGDSHGETNIGFDMTKLQFGLKYIF
ncbi:MAG: hypothetical protein ACR2MS_12410 [Weeksellaceae bacterium]